MSTELVMNRGGHFSHPCNGPGATKPKTGKDCTSHQKSRWVGADNFGLMLLKGECTSESPGALIRTQIPGLLVQSF